MNQFIVGIRAELAEFILSDLTTRHEDIGALLNEKMAVITNEGAITDKSELTARLKSFKIATIEGIQLQPFLSDRINVVSDAILGQN